MKQIPDLSVDVLAGGKLSELTCRPLPPFSSHAIEFLTELSKSLIRNPASRLYPEIMAFAYWCRSANLHRLSREFGDPGHRIGRGLVFHIAPANVPINFAFSFAFGVLAGNANIVRLPSESYPQVNVICTEIKRLFSTCAHNRIAGMNCLIRYSRNDEVTSLLSECCHARMLWGGDNTITQIRAMPASPRCVDIAFADRYSLCLIEAGAIIEADDDKMKDLTLGFYNDVFLFGQNACSSPHLILWKGDDRQAEAAMLRFWSSIKKLLDTKEPIPAIHAVNKYIHLCRTAITLPYAETATCHDNLIYRVRLNDLPRSIENYRGQHGFFFEYICDSLDCLRNVVEERFQTLTYFGVDKENVIQYIIDEGLTGIDRVVPIGKALDISVIWDGYDVIGTLSRIVSSH